MIELGKLLDAPPLKEQVKHNLLFHIALESEDPDREVDYLVKNSAKFIGSSLFLVGNSDPLPECKSDISNI